MFKKNRNNCVNYTVCMPPGLFFVRVCENVTSFFN